MHRACANAVAVASAVTRSGFRNMCPGQRDAAAS